MKRFLFAVVLLVLVSSVAVAEDFPKVEVFGGYSIMNMHGQNNTVVNSYTPTIYGEMFTNGSTFSTPEWLKKGFTASVTYNLNQYLGIEASFQRNAGDIFQAKFSNGTYDRSFELRASDMTFNIGPRFAFRKYKVLTPFAHALIGLDHFNISPQYAIGGTENNAAYPTTLTNTIDTGFGLILGGGVDANINKHIAIRVIQVDYLASTHNGVIVNSLKHDADLNSMNLSCGVVIRFGGKK
jgi:opacity protein-like surface antigen